MVELIRTAYGVEPDKILGGPHWLELDRYDIMAQALGAHGEYVEKPEDIRPALDRAQKKIDEGMCALVNVKTDYRARATTVRFSSRET